MDNEVNVKRGMDPSAGEIIFMKFLQSLPFAAVLLVVPLDVVAEGTTGKSRTHSDGQSVNREDSTQRGERKGANTLSGVPTQTPLSGGTSAAHSFEEQNRTHANADNSRRQGGIYTGDGGRGKEMNLPGNAGSVPSGRGSGVGSSGASTGTGR